MPISHPADAIDFGNTLDSSSLWLSYARSSVGHIRRANEDSFLDAREQNLWVVADGMGGHSRGDRASQTIIEHLVGFKAQATHEASVDDIRKRLFQANTVCRQITKGKVMGSTVVLLYRTGNRCSVIWAGDSRMYCLRKGRMKQITEDHSLVQELCRLGELTPEQAENHPSSNVITRAVGVHDTLNLDVVEFQAEPGDRFLLCSDGLFKDVRQNEVLRSLAHPALEQSLNLLVKKALIRGGTDNVTAIVVQADAPPLPESEPIL